MGDRIFRATLAIVLGILVQLLLNNVCNMWVGKDA